MARGYEGRELNRGIRRREGRKIKTDGRSQCHNISYDGVVTVGGSDGQDCPRLLLGRLIVPSRHHWLLSFSFT